MKNRVHGRGGDIKRRIGLRLGIPDEMLCSGLLVEMRGKSRVNVFGCRRIVKYTDKEIAVALAVGFLSVNGDGLVCESYHSGCVSIGGEIRSVTFLEEWQGADTDED